MRGISQSLPGAFVSPDGTSAACPALEERIPLAGNLVSSQLGLRWPGGLSCREEKVGRRRFYVRVTSFAFELALTSSFFV